LVLIKKICDQTSEAEQVTSVTERSKYSYMYEWYSCFN
jgi:hypothetical protein